MKDENIISFSTNWNNKLDCKAFTTVRINNTEKYQTCREYQITLRNKPIATAKIISIRTFWLDEITDFVSYLDTGYDRKAFIEIILKMYPRVDFKRKPLMLILLEKMKNPETKEKAQITQQTQSHWYADND